MAKIARFYFILFLTLAAFQCICAQTQGRVEISPQILADGPKKKCREFEPGKLIFIYEPEYPAEALAAQVSGKVNVTVKIDVTGNSLEIVSVTGTTEFRELGSSAARKLKFSPTKCDGKIIPVTAVISYNFILESPPENYFFPASAKEFTDLKSDSPYFFPISQLTDNYQICFGYSDNKFHENSPLTRGDFAQFLRLTLDLLFKRAAEARKIPRQIGLIRTYNPQNLSSVNSIKGLEKKQPFYRSVGILLQTYNISLVNSDMNFNGNSFMTKNEVIELWENIFTDDALPVNFEKDKVTGKNFTRGEFALFLQESMQVLTYKVLP